MVVTIEMYRYSFIHFNGCYYNNRSRYWSFTCVTGGSHGVVHMFHGWFTRVTGARTMKT